MSSKKCLSCGFADFAEAETCKRCGEQMPSARQSRYREQMSAAPAPAPAAQPKGNFRVTVVIVLACALVGVLWLGFVKQKPTRKLEPQAQSAALPAAPATLGSAARREVFAGYLQEEYQKTGWNVRVSVSGYDNTTILMASPVFAGLASVDSSSVPALAGFKSRLKTHGFQQVIFSDGQMPVATESIPQ